jgi:general secretion pathway protein A
MYEAFYGLSNKPFQLNPDPRFYFSSQPHQRARSYLVYGVMRGEGFIVITGEVGAGKTTIVRDLLDHLDDGAVVAAHLVSTQLGAEDALRLVCGAFVVPVRGTGKADLLMALEAFFITQTTQGKRCLLVVDEAQNLQHHAVEELRMLSNFQFGDKALLQTFLVGQPEFRDILQSPGMLQLRQRVSARCHLGPLDADDTRAYIEHRLACAGATGKPSFDADVFAAIHEHAGGIPRRINALCDRLLLQGFLSDVTHFTLEALDEVVAEMRAENASPASPTSSGLAPAGATGAPTLRSWPTDPRAGAACLCPGGAPGDGGDLGDLGDGGVRGDLAGLGALELDPELIGGLGERLSHASAQQLGARLLRLERSVLHQQRIGQDILSALQQLVQAARKSPAAGPGA